MPQNHRPESARNRLRHNMVPETEQFTGNPPYWSSER